MIKRFLGLVLLGVVLLSLPLYAQPPDTIDEPLNADLPPRSRIALAERLRGVESIPTPPATTRERQEGEQQVFSASNSAANETFQVTATLRVVGEHIYLWVENGASVDDEDLRELARTFDTRIYPEVRALWGSEASPGVDGDPRIHGLFVGNLGPSTAAYFSSDHTYPREVVPISNEHEMFFFNLNTIGSPFPQFDVQSIVAHEFQHMIRENVQSNEDYWLNEGFSEFTQAYLYNAPMWETFLFLTAPGTQLNTWSEAIQERGANYGAALLFVSYFYHRYGLDALRELSLDPSARGLVAVDNVLRARGEPGVDEFFADWVLANVLNDDDIAEGRYSYGQFLPWLDITAAPIAQVRGLPFEWLGEVNQYATDYFQLIDLDGVSTITVELDAPSLSPLLPVEAENGSRFLYSNRGDVSNTTVTRAFDLSGVTTASLDYRVWYHTEDLWDYGYVMVSEDDGESWDILSTPYTTDRNPFGTGYGNGYTGTSGGWLDELISLDAYTGEEILVRFEVITDDAVTQHGMAIDDVRVSAIGYSEDFETSDGGWSADGWVWTDNLLDQSVWVQVTQVAGDTVQVSRFQAPNDGSTWTVDVLPNADRAFVAVSPFAPVTTVPMPYTLRVAAGS